MSFVFADGVDHYDNDADLLKKWTGTGPFAGTVWTDGAGRFGGGAIDHDTNHSIFTVFNARSTLIVGTAFKLTGSDDAPQGVMQLAYRGEPVLTVGINPDNTLTIVRGDVGAGVIGSAEALVTTTVGLNEDTWFYLEWKTIIASSGGYTELRVNGQTRATYSGDTDAQDAGVANDFYLGVVGGRDDVDALYDDIYIVDDEGTENNDFLGDVEIDTLLPTADTVQADFTPLTGGDNYLEVDDPNLDDDDTYNFSEVVGAEDRFQAEDLADTPDEIFAVIASIVAKKEDAGSRGMQAVVESGASREVATEQFLETGYLYYQYIFPTDPDTGSPWTKAGVDNAEYGYILSS